MKPFSNVELQFTPRSANNLQTIHAYCAKTWGTDHADSYIDRIKNVLELIRLNPFIGRPRREFGADIRSYPAEQHLIFYSVIGNVVIVRTVLHARMDIPSRLPPEVQPE